MGMEEDRRGVWEVMGFRVLRVKGGVEKWEIGGERWWRWGGVLKGSEWSGCFLRVERDEEVVQLKDAMVRE